MAITERLHLNTGLTTAKRLILSMMVLAGVYLNVTLQAQTGISTINTTTTAGTSSSNTAVIPSDAGNSIADDNGETMTINYGQGNNVKVSSYVVSSITYDRFLRPDTLILNRTTPSDRLVNIWYTLNSAIIDNTPPTNDVANLDSDEASDADAIYLTGNLNAGYDNILVNTDNQGGGAIEVQTERVDVLWFSGIQTSVPSTAVFPIIERGGNDNIAVAAITSLNPDGTPASYGTLIGIPENGWPGAGSTFDDYLVLRRETAGSTPLPLLPIGVDEGQPAQTIQGVAVSFTELGISANQSIFGYSIFSADVVSGYTTETGQIVGSGAQTVKVGVDLTDIATFPTDTNSDDSGLDLVAGVSAAVASDDNLIETKGPGGYKAALATWLKANDGAFVTNGGAASTEGVNVGFWEDQSVGNNDFTTLTTAPTFRSTTSAINFNPTVDFLDGSETGLLTPNNEAYNVKPVNDGYNKKSINIAFRTPDSTPSLNNKQQIFEEGGGTNGLGIYVRNSTLYMSVWNKGAQAQGDWNDSGSAAQAVSIAVLPNTEYIITMEFNGDPTSSGSGSITGYLNGQQFGSLTTPFGQNIGLLYNHSGGIGLGQHNGASLYDDNDTEGDSFYGEISEFIYCNEPGSFVLSQRQRIESYLAIKYGITLDQSTPLNYVNSDGDIIFDATNNASLGGFLEYNNDIAGIGRDDASELDQSASRSENTGSVVTIDRGATISTDDTWLIWGNDGGALTESSVVSSPSTIDTRLERVWRVAERNDVLTTSVSFDITGLGLSTDQNDFSLLVASNSSNADFNSATVLTGGTLVGNTLTFTGVDLVDGQYFTLGTANFFCTPGRYNDGIIMWLRADEGVTTATEGANVTLWADQTPTGNDAINITAPVYRATTNLINDNPTIDFSTGSTGIAPPTVTGINDGESLSKKFTIVFKTGDITSTTRQVIYEQGGATRGLNVYIETSTLHISGWNQASDGTGAPWNTAGSITTVNTTSIASNTTYVLTFDYAGNDAITGTITGYLNGVSFGTPLSNVGRLYGHTDAVGLGDENGTSRYDDGSTSGASSFDGFISEISYYSAPSSYLSTDRNRIESSMAIKYGITLDQSSATNYTRSDATTIWDGTTNATYNNDIAGIGRDDDACLDQKQSQSENAGSIVKMGLTSIEATNADNANTFDDDGDFLVWGNDGDFADQGNANTSNLPGSVTERMERIWKVEDTGMVGATSISFDLSGLGYSTNVSDFQLIISDTNVGGDFSGATTVPAASYDVGTNTVTFTGVDLTDGQFFTLGTDRDVCAPGGVEAGLLLSLKGDVGTTGTGNVTAWADQSANSFSATATTGPERLSNGINFNPSLQFNGTNEEMVISGGILGTSSPNDLVVFAVTEVNTVKGSWLFFEPLASSGRFSAHLPWIDGNAYYDYPNASEGNGRISEAWGSSTGTPHLWTLFSSTSTLATASGNANKAILRDGTVLDTNTSSITGTGINGNFNIASGGGGFYAANISEILIYNSAPNEQELEQIQTYFAIKYGIFKNSTDIGSTLTVDESDYFDANATVIWDRSSNSDYHQDVAGIGRDDASCLNQKQSSSEASDDILTVGLGAIAADNASNANSFADDGDYFVWGNDNEATAEGSKNTVHVPGNVSERMARVWRAQNTGDVSNLELQFDLTGTGFSTSDATRYSLLVSNEPTMASASVVVGGSFNSDVLSFTGVNIANGQYFTIGSDFETCGPGGVNTNISVWLAANKDVFSDAGTTLAVDGANVIQWNDQSSPAINASEIDLGGGASAVEPTLQTNEINSNPVIQITDPNSSNASYLRTASTAVTGNFTLISVFSTGQSSGTDEDVLNSPALLSSRNAGSLDHAMGMENGTLWLHADSDNGFEVQSTSTYNNNEPHFATATKSGTALSLFVDGQADGTGTGTATLTNATGFAIGNHFNFDLQAQYAGEIAETIVFSSALDSDQRNRVESYLALKYGITMNATDDGGTGGVDERDYRAGDGGVIWDFTGQTSTYYNDIFGIGRDDLSCFEQTQAKSENNDALVTFNQSGSFTNDDSFLVSGNDNAAVEQEGNTERPSGINSRLNREWRVQETGTVGSIELTYDMSTITGPLGVGTNNLTQLRLMVDDDGDFTSGVTLLSPSSFNGSENTVTFTVDFTNGQYYTLGSEEKAALPVELLSFEANAKDEIVDLNWSTVSETNNAFFTVERSSNGMDFESLANIDGAGTSQGVIRYHYADRNPLDGFSFYRLRQTDFSGEYDYSEVQSVYVERSDEIEISLFPNPIRIGETLKMSHNLLEPQSAIIQIFDLNGRVSLKREIALEPAKAMIEIETNSMSRGINVIKLILQNGESFTYRVLLK